MLVMVIFPYICRCKFKPSNMECRIKASRHLYAGDLKGKVVPSSDGAFFFDYSIDNGFGRHSSKCSLSASSVSEVVDFVLRVLGYKWFVINIV